MRFLLLTSAVLLAGCTTLPERPAGTLESFRVSPPSPAQLEALVGPRHPGHSGVALLADGSEALLARLALADAATKTIDVQYYIWRGDAVGLSIIERLLDAADRGVRVRMLVDDLNVVGLDRRIAGLHAHPDIEIRFFNPFRFRKPFGPLRRGLEFVTGAARLNHRMHNKVFAVDNIAAIVGGRNLTNAYFGADASYSYRDIDLLTVGPVVDDISRSFDEYWNSDWALPLDALSNVGEADPQEFRSSLSNNREALLESFRALDTTDYIPRIADELTWCYTEVVVDPPVKAAGAADFVSPVTERLIELARATETQILVENAFFIPGEEGVQRLSQHVARGVDVRILTNSLASNDGGASHAGYQRYRRRLLEAGVELYELRPDAELRRTFELAPSPVRQAGLHSKVATFDRSIAFVGSFNLDPRSMRINTEVGVIVHDPGFASELAELLEYAMKPENSWRLELDDKRDIDWVAEQRLRHEPSAGFAKRFVVWVLSLLPVESQL